MTRDTFISVAGKYLSDVQAEAVRLFDDGVAHDRCVPIALSIVDGRDIKKARQAEALMGARATLPLVRQ